MKHKIRIKQKIKLISNSNEIMLKYFSLIIFVKKCFISNT